MSRSKRRKQELRAAAKARKTRNPGREQLVMAIVKTDMTFAHHESVYDAMLGSEPVPGIWIGKCIHCNRKLGVSDNGKTDATIEHVNPLCAGGDPTDPKNLALACSGCNNEKGVRHDKHAGKGGRADEVITALQGKRLARWRDSV